MIDTVLVFMLVASMLAVLYAYSLRENTMLRLVCRGIKLYADIFILWLRS